MNELPQRAVRLLLYVTIVSLTAFGGSASTVTRLAALVAWACLLLTLIQSKPAGQYIKVTALAFLIIVVCMAWSFFQVSPIIWSHAGDLMAGRAVLSSVERLTISISPADTLQTLVAVLLPFSVFLITLHAFEEENRVTRLIALCGALGLVVAVYGIVIYLSGNKWLLFSEKLFYRGNLTSVFVNRNAAANFLGIALSCLTALFCHRVQILRHHHVMEVVGSRYQAVLFLISLCWLGVFSALMLTGSRAGAATALISVILIGGLFFFGLQRGGTVGARMKRHGLWAVSGLLGLTFLTAASGSQIFFRIQSTWSYDPRFCILPGLVRLWSDNWLFGTGLGTFALAFPPYKEASCGLAELWLQAHNFYLEAAITFGIPFLILTPVAMITLYWCFIEGLRQRRRYRWVSALGIGLLTQQLIHNVVDFPMQNPAIATMFASLMAGCVRVSLARPRTSHVT